MGRASRAKKQRRETGIDPRRQRNPLDHVTATFDHRTQKTVAPRPRWNGELCEARRVLVMVAPWMVDGEPSKLAWSTALAGTVRAAVEVRYADQPVFYLDDEPVNPFDEPPEMMEWRRDRGMPFQRGYLGCGWDKITKGMGSPQWAHRQLSIERVVSCRDCLSDEEKCTC